MASVLSDLTPADWAIIGILVLVPLLMVLGVHAIRTEVRAVRRIEVRSITLKTSREQRRKWRQEAASRDLLNLLDDVETLLRLTNADETAARKAHKEAVGLSWMSYHIPIRVAILGSLLLAGALSAIFMVVAQGPSNPIP